MKILLRIIPVVAIATALHAPALAVEAGSLSCSRGIVSVGDTAGEVLAKCGQPATATQREEKKVTEGAKGSRERTVTSISIDDWLFNFGPNQFQYRVLLENGRVARIESLGYGY